jgi:SAM-dependent methyltransferase
MKTNADVDAPSDKPLAMPAPEPNGFVRTLNSMGYMTATLDPFSQAFVDFAPNAPARALDIGAAYGVATVPALRAGAHVVANDVDERHLAILRNRMADPLKERLTLAPGDFPEKLDFAPGSIGAVLICRVMHFFDGPTIERAAAKVLTWLAPGGKVFVVSETPFIGTARGFFPTYQERLKAGDPWPGFIKDMVAHFDPARAKQLPPSMHLLDEPTLRRVFTKAGFVIERLELFARPEFPKDIQLDGRESVGLIARKP